MQLARTFDRALGAGVLAVLVLAPTQYSFEVAAKTYLSLVDPVLWVVFAAWAAAVLRARAWRLLRLPAWSALLFVAATALSTLAAGSRAAALKDAFQYAEYFVAAWLLFAWYGDDAPARRSRLLAALGLVTAAVVLCAAVQYAGGRPDFRVGGTFGNRNVLGGYLALVLPLLFALTLHEPRPLRRAAGLAVVALGLLVNLSGGSFIALFAVLPVVAAARGARAFAATAAALGVLAIAVLPHLPRANASVLADAVAVYTDEGDPTPRYPEWQAAAIMAAENRWLGVGAGNYQANVGTFYGSIPNAVRAAEPDTQNLYLVLASSLGLPGLACFLFLLAHGIGRGLRAPDAGAGQEDRRDRAARLGASASLAAFAVNAVWSPLLVRGIGIPLALVLSLAFATGRRAPGGGTDAARAGA